MQGGDCNLGVSQEARVQEHHPQSPPLYTVKKERGSLRKVYSGAHHKQVSHAASAEATPICFSLWHEHT